MNIKTKEEALEYLNIHNKPFRVNNITYKRIYVSIPELPESEGGIGGFGFIYGNRNTITGEMDDRVFGFSLFHDGRRIGPGLPLSKRYLQNFDIDWDAGTAIIKPVLK